nr:EAL domain-containing protein [Rhabdothermincola salaria]
MAGPLTPGNVEEGTPQDLSDWLVRGLFFLVIGVAVSVAIRQGLQVVLTDHRARRRRAELRRALAHGEVELHYQPIVDLDDGRIVGAEALVRWRHPTKGLLAPVEFIDDFEQLDESTDWVIGQVAETVGGWKERLSLDRFHVAVNISGHDLGRGSLPERVEALLAPTALAPSDLCLEVTESAVVQDLDEAAATLAALRLAGTTIAIDDLGTGHATLAYVQRLPVDIVKIDKTFTAELRPGSPSEAIVAALIGLSRQLDVGCIAEGIETEDQRAAVVRHGCRQGQGFLFSPAVPADQFERMLAAPHPAAPGQPPRAR